MHDSETVRAGYFRFNSYRMVNGCLTPAPDAVPVDENPWDRYGENARRYRRFDQPYLGALRLNAELQRLHGRVALSPRRPMETGCPPVAGPQNDVETLLLDWVNSNGLLSILPARCDWIHAAEPTRIVEFHRHGGLWSKRTTPATKPKPEYHWWNWERETWVTHPLTKMWEFFPLSANPREFLESAIPHPGSPEFWRSYGEPVDRFAQTISNYAAAVATMSAPPPASEVGQFKAAQSFRFLRGLAAPAETRFYFDETSGQLRRAAFAPGLISSYALMYLMDRDAESQRRVHFCEVCGSAFVSNEYQARYCSTAHRNTASSNRYRARKKGSDDVTRE